MILKQAREVLKLEAQGILDLIERLDQKFVEVVEIICQAKGRLIVSGIGKSGIIGRKMAATYNSTGTRSIFMHPVEAMHGDMGMVSKEDIFLALSNSGETHELNILIPNIRIIGCLVIAFTGGLDSTLAKCSDLVIDVGVSREACPLGLAPTTSTTALLAMGDALAVALINKKDFKTSDFKKFHPGGKLGQRLSSNVYDIMQTGPIPSIQTKTLVVTAINQIEHGRTGAVFVLNQNKTLAGVITDGDIRRMLFKTHAFKDLKAADIMSIDPQSIRPDTPVYDALNIMEQFQITILPVVDATGRIIGILHLHDILGKGKLIF